MSLSVIPLRNFEEIWKLFDRKMFQLGGSLFLVEPLENYFTIDFVSGLDKDRAKLLFHEDLTKWGEIEQTDHEKEIIDTIEFPDGTKHSITQFKDPNVRWARKFILTAFYNLCCLAARKITIEELIFIANTIPNTKNSKEINKAFFELIGISNSFLSAEWARQIIQRAVSNRDTKFFKELSKWLIKDIPSERFITARTWLGTTMLWYLGGKDIPRRDFMIVLRDYKLIPKGKDEYSFNAELSKLKLIK